MIAETTGARPPRILSAALAALLTVFISLTWSAGLAHADFGIKPGTFKAELLDSGGGVYTQAGGHPYEGVTSFEFNTEQFEGPFGPSEMTEGFVKDVDVDLPAGFFANPRAVAQCPPHQLSEGTGEGGGTGVHLVCPVASQVGIASVTIGNAQFHFPNDYAIFNVTPPSGTIAMFGFVVEGVPVFIKPVLRPDGNYALRASTHNTPTPFAIFSTKVALWGVPADSSHDAQRWDPTTGFFGAPSQAPKRPFLTAPAYCAGGPVKTVLHANSYGEPDRFVTETAISPAPTGCDRLTFTPTIEVSSSTSRADSSDGLAVAIDVPQTEALAGSDTPPLRDVTVTMPPGLTINPASATGLQACGDAALGLGSANPLDCHSAARIGTVEATTPLLEETLSGGVYLRSQASNDPASGEMFRIALALENDERGISIRLPGALRVDPASGRIEVSFKDNPQLPVSHVEVRLKTGDNAPLSTATTCGPQTVSARFTSWGGQEAQDEAHFRLDAGAGGDCPAGLAGRAFTPKLSAGIVDPLAGGSSPFVFRLTRQDGEQEITSVAASLPPGLSGKLAGIPQCSDSALGSIGTLPGTGISERDRSACPGASQIGFADVGAGTGGSPFFAGGKVYLAGPYKGAPFSLAVVTPALAGPFDLGNVVVRVALEVDPTTAAVTAVSDDLPLTVAGVPLRIRDIRLGLDRPGFVQAPTSCEPMRIDARVNGASGAGASLSDRFQVTNCAALAFKPHLKLKVKGATKRGKYPKLRAELRAPEGQANIGKVSVALPHSEFLAQEHIKTICTRVQYSAQGGGGKACPAGSVYGWARAFTPLLDQPLEGPVFLRSSSNPLPDLVASLDGQIHIDLAGRIDSVNGGIRNTFEAVPDAPVSKFVLTMQGGKKSLLVNSRDLCATKNRATVKMDGQNGKVHDFRPLVGNSCKGKARKGATQHRRG